LLLFFQKKKILPSCPAAEDCETDMTTALPPVYALVPGAPPVELVAYYENFAEYYPEAELQTRRWFVENVQPDWVILDIGANVGAYSVLFARLAANGHVHAFEPTSTANMLRRNLAAARADNVTVHEIALGARSGEYEEPIYRIWGAAPETQTYRFTTLDDFVRASGSERIDCIKIDVDGFDLEVLKGATETLKKFDPWVVIEINHALATRGQTEAEALLWLRAQGYRHARVLDDENYVLKRSMDRDRSAGDDLVLTFDREPVLLPPALGPGFPVEDFFAPEPVLHNDAELLSGPGQKIAATGPRWSFMASWARREAASATGAVIVEIELEVESGMVGLGCLAADAIRFIGKEITASAAPGRQMVQIFVPDAEAVRYLMLRNVEPEGASGVVTVWAIRVAMAKPVEKKLSPVLASNVREFDLDACLPVAGAPDLRHRQIPIVSVGRLGEALGFATPYTPVPSIYRYGLENFKTEIDEAGLYRYLWREFAPKRHLEFGTWEGVGVVLCAESCAAEIWTMNLPEGERDAEGRPVYGRQDAPADETLEPGDSGERIGWRYRAAGYGDRAHQILCDSRDFADHDFTDGFFDSILIDGGHTPELVASDTNKALRLLRPGGLMIWHDFCPDPAALAASEAGRGVMQAMVTHYESWRPHFSTMFWVRPSWLFIGVKSA
jgi:FkbM family methyltransferase